MHFLFALLLIPVGFLLMAWNKSNNDKEKAKHDQSQQAAANEGPEGLAWTPMTDRDDKAWEVRLRKRSDGSARIVSRWRVWAALGVWMLIVLGMGAASVGLFYAGKESGNLWFGFILPPITLVLGMICVVKVRAALHGVAFDWQGRVCRGFLARQSWFGLRVEWTDISFDRVAGLQLMSRWNEERNPDSAKRYEPGYTTYQLNLVLKDHSRCNLMAHGNLSAMESDAQVLSEILGVPLWRRA